MDGVASGFSRTKIMRSLVVPRTIRYGLVLAVLLALACAGVFAQRGRYPRAELATEDSFDGAWHFCRLAYQGRSWATDFPDADYNFTVRLSELTKTTVSRKIDGEVNPLIVRPVDDALFQCPFVMLWQAETLYFSPADAARLRDYLLKGGFIWADDSWGSFAWDNFAREMAKVLPPPKYEFVDIPADHPMLSAFYAVKRVPQIPAINYWLGSGGDTSEQGYDSAEVHVRGMFDERGRLMVLNTHNTDVADGWEREGVDPRYFRMFSLDSYAVGINVLMYIMTH
jgi:hypothetical protein